MKIIITYGTFDLFHKGHENILRRAKELGDYLIVGVTSDFFDFRRGKINVFQSTVERIKNVEYSGFADKVIVEEKEDQKIEDIIKYKVDTIVLGSDWFGKIDYLKNYCNVVYLPRTVGVSSTLIRGGYTFIKIGMIGSFDSISKNFDEINIVGTNEIKWILSNSSDSKQFALNHNTDYFTSLDQCPDLDFIHISDWKDAYKCAYKLLIKSNIYISEKVDLTRKQIKELYRIAQLHNKTLCITPYYVFNPVWSSLFNSIQTDIIGTIYNIEITLPIKKSGANYILSILYIINRFIIKLDIESIKLDKYIIDPYLINYRIYTDSLLICIKSNAVINKNSFIITGTKGKIKLTDSFDNLNGYRIKNMLEKKDFYGPHFSCEPRFAFQHFIKSISDISSCKDEYFSFLSYEQLGCIYD